jgi:hypothetical protein
MSDLYFLDTVDSSELEPPYPNSFTLTLNIWENKEILGTFQYSIEGYCPDNENERELVANIWSYSFTEVAGICTWNQLPKDCQEKFVKLISPEQKLRFDLVSKTLITDGFLVISHNKLDKV